MIVSIFRTQNFKKYFDSSDNYTNLLSKDSGGIVITIDNNLANRTFNLIKWGLYLTLFSDKQDPKKPFKAGITGSGFGGTALGTSIDGGGLGYSGGAGGSSDNSNYSGAMTNVQSYSPGLAFETSTPSSNGHVVHWIKLISFMNFKYNDLYYINHKPKITVTIDDQNTSISFKDFIKKYGLKILILDNEKLKNTNVKQLNQIPMVFNNTKIKNVSFKQIVNETTIFNNTKIKDINFKQIDNEPVVFNNTNFKSNLYKQLFDMNILSLNNKKINPSKFNYNLYQKFKPVLDISYLQCPTSEFDPQCGTKDFNDFANNHFYYDTNNLIFEACGEHHRSELRFNKEWKFDGNLQELDATVKIQSFTQAFTFLQIHGIKDSLDKPVLRVATFNDNIKAFIYNGSSYEKYVLGTVDDQYHDYKIVAGNNTLLVYMDGEEKVNTTIKYPSACFFKCGVYLQRDGCAKSMFKAIDVKYD